MKSSYWTRLSRQRLSRRALLRSAALGAAVTAGGAAMGCGEGADRAEPAGATRPGVRAGATEEPRRGGVLTSVLISGFNLDPMIDIIAGAHVISSRVYSHLLTVRADTAEGVPILVIPEGGVEQPDELTYIFTLRDDVHFHDNPDVRSRYPTLAGRQLTAEDVKFSRERYRDLTEAPGRDYHLNFYDRTEVVSPTIARIINKKPNAWTLGASCLANIHAGSTIPHEVIEKEGDLKTTAIGSGPFMLKSSSQTKGIELERNPSYFVPDEPLLDGMKFIISNDPASTLAAFRSGQIDWMGAVDIKMAEDALGAFDDAELRREAGFGYLTIGVRGDRSPWTDERVRKALHLSIDRQDLINKMEFGEGKPSGPVTWMLAAWSLSDEELTSLEAYHYKPDEAIGLLKAAGCESIDVTMKHANVGSYAEVATIVKDQLRKVGINVTLEPQDAATYVPVTLFGRNFDMTCFYNLRYDSPALALRHYTSRGIAGDGSWFHYDDPEIDAMYDQAAETFPLEERKELILELQRVILRKFPPIISAYAPYALTVYRTYVRGSQPELGWANAFNYRIWLTQ